jgi:hypothetical protein
MEAADNVIGDCQNKVAEIITVLRSLDGISAGGLAKLMSSSGNFPKTRVWEEQQLDPGKKRTWDIVLVADNRKFPHPELVGRRLRDVIDEFGLADLSGMTVPTGTVEWRDWFNQVHIKLKKNLGRSRHRLSEDLQFIGTAEHGIERFTGISEGATLVYNTVFTRSEPQSRHARDLSFRIEDVKRRLLSGGKCYWIELVLEKEVAGLMPYLQQMTDKERENYKAAILPNLPMFQCLVFRRVERSGAAFVGWFVPGSGESRVFFTEDWQNVQYFLDYCDKLLNWKGACELIIPPRDDPPAAT